LLKDDQTMTLITILVVIVAVGTAVYQTGWIERHLSDQFIELDLVRDEVLVRSNQLTGIDVLKNDPASRAVMPTG